jgi:ADP-heptose:LPS heptosyltransferase
MILNITKETFGGSLRNGDLIAVGNVVEYLRRANNKFIKFHLHPDAIQSDDYCQKFFHFLTSNTNYFSIDEGETILSWRNINLWDFRSISGDLVKIDNFSKKEKKIAVFPLLNAKYNLYRNWPKSLFKKIIDDLNDPKYNEFRKVICSEYEFQIPGFENSIDFMENIHHIMTCDFFIGGDTGTSHFVGALNNGPSKIIYHYSGRGLLHTTPINYLNGKGTLSFYWVDPENSNWG